MGLIIAKTAAYLAATIAVVGLSYAAIKRDDMPLWWCMTMASIIIIVLWISAEQMIWA